MSHTEQSSPEPLVFGEVLFDHFSDGSRVLGGAPFNVAWHLQGFGRGPLFVSAVGKDEAGREVAERMRGWGMRTEGLQIDSGGPTGRVTAKIVDGEPAFEIEDDQAYDHVRRDEAVKCLEGRSFGPIYHGTLALRHAPSRGALEGVRQASDAPTFVDLNLRRPWWTQGLIDTCLDGARWVKLNRDELTTVTGQPVDSVAACRERAATLAEARDLEAVIVTMGSDGSLMARDGRSWVSEPRRLDPAEVVDTVGAGDAFSAVACIGLVESWDPDRILARGDAFAMELCRVRGATTPDRALYERHLERWERT
ncbi:MAG: PfkB family carbohydrate kinase [Gemmatimonadota bacterium]|jgi:fructokinase